jgi:hypothetical protein
MSGRALGKAVPSGPGDPTSISPVRSVVMMRSRAIAGLLFGFLGAAAAATPYYVGFEGDRMPEEVPGYVRHFGGGGATRSIETDPNGTSYFVSDSRASGWIWDTGYCARQINCAPGELFLAEWRLAVVDNLDYYNTGLIFARDGRGTLFFSYSIDHIISQRENYWSYPITPHVFHTYRIESWDMVNYRLWIDGDVVRDGWWDLDSINESFVSFGDEAYGNVHSGALAKWDYFRFAVVPEPASLCSLLLVCVCAAAHRR